MEKRAVGNVGRENVGLGEVGRRIEDVINKLHLIFSLNL